jgi:glutaredoxin
MIVLYSNHCPKCDITKAKLDAKNINYTLIDDTEWLSANEFDQMPVLEVDGNRMISMIEINNFINAQ